jgi:Fur family ferric uptake transcriptional regulator
MEVSAHTNFEVDVQRLREGGHKVTRARRAVLQALHESGGHVTSAQVLARVQAIAPAVGRASVFRTLEMLTGLGIVRPTYLQPGSPSYVLMSRDGHHAHIVCTHCLRVIELDECHAESLLGDLAARFDVELSGHLLEVYGLCADCRDA